MQNINAVNKNHTYFTDNICLQAQKCGFAKCGIIRIDDLIGYDTEVQKRQKLFPEAEAALQRIQSMMQIPEKYNWAKSVIVAITPYGKYKIPPGWDKYIAKTYLFDYRTLHESSEEQNHLRFEAWLQNENIRFVSDREVRIPARWAAMKAGFGSIGRNNFFYDEHYGSWVFIETWLIDKELESPKTPSCKQNDAQEQSVPRDTCPATCKRCIDACPTKALSEPFRTNPIKCVTRQTYGLDNDGLTPEHMRPDLGYKIYGCDICQNVCLRNRNKWQQKEDFPFSAHMKNNPTLIDILSYGKKELTTDFCTLLKGREHVLKCNIIRAMANELQAIGIDSKHLDIDKQHYREYLEYIEAARNSKDENVRTMADWAKRQISL